MTEQKFELIAKVLVDQHYASGPDEMKQVIAQALKEAASGNADCDKDAQDRLTQEVNGAIEASRLGSE